MMLILFSCSSSIKSQDSNRGQSSCTCAETLNADTIIFATNVRLKKTSAGNSLLFNCASVEKGIASVSDENGENEREQYIYDINCISATDHSIELSEDFKYFTEILQPQEHFFEAIKNSEKLFFEFTLEDRKVKLVLKLNIDE